MVNEDGFVEVGADEGTIRELAARFPSAVKVTINLTSPLLVNLLNLRFFFRESWIRLVAMRPQDVVARGTCPMSP